MTLLVMPSVFAVCRLEPNSKIPDWSLSGSFISLSRTADELSIVCEQAQVPASVQCERDWKLLKVAGPLDFSLTGILASIANPLAQAKVSIFAVSTFDTDYVLVRAKQLEATMTALQAAGFRIQQTKM